MYITAWKCILEAVQTMMDWKFTVLGLSLGLRKYCNYLRNIKDEAVVAIRFKPSHKKTLKVSFSNKTNIFNLFSRAFSHSCIQRTFIFHISLLVSHYIHEEAQFLIYIPIFSTYLLWK